MKNLLSPLLFSFSLLGVLQGRELPVGLLIDGCPRDFNVPPSNIEADGILGNWYLHSVANLPMHVLQHGPCTTISYYHAPDGQLRFTATHVHEGAFITIEGDYSVQQNAHGELNFNLKDHSIPASIIGIVDDEYYVVYGCESDLLDGKVGFGQIWVFTKDPTIPMEDIQSVVENMHLGEYDLPSLTKVPHGGDCIYPEGF